MAIKDFKIKERPCTCDGGDDCECNRFEFTYMGEFMARSHRKDTLEKLLEAIRRVSDKKRRD